MRLLLIRHGETSANQSGQISSWAPGERLTPTGEAQADRLAADLRGQQIDGVFSSTLTRAEQTAGPLADALGLPVQVVDGLQEIEAGEFEGGTTHEQLAGYLGPLARWGLGELDAAHPGAFDGHHFVERFDAAIAYIADAVGPDGTAAVVTHSACIGVWAAGPWTDVTPQYSTDHPLKNLDIVELSGSPADGWTCVRWAGAEVK